MATAINNSGVLFPDNSTQTSAKQSAKAFAVFINSTIYSSFNVSSTSRVSTGLYQMNYSTAGPNQWNCAVATVSVNSDGDLSRCWEIGGQNNSTGVRVITGVRNGGNVPIDVAYLSILVHW